MCSTLHVDHLTGYFKRFGCSVVGILSNILEQVPTVHIQYDPLHPVLQVLVHLNVIILKRVCACVPCWQNVVPDVTVELYRSNADVVCEGALQQRFCLTLVAATLGLAYRGRCILSERAVQTMQNHRALQTQAWKSLFTVLPPNDPRPAAQPSLTRTEMIKRGTEAPPRPLQPDSATSLVDQANLVENWYKDGDKMLSKTIQQVWLGCM